MTRMRWLFGFLFLALVIGLALRHLPPTWDPRTPLDLAAPPNLLTGWKLTRMAWQPEQCRAAFAASRIALFPVPDRASEDGCALRDAVRLPAALRLSPGGPVVSCPMAAAWALFERHTLQQAARAHLGSEVAAVRQLGAYACRNVNHAAAGRRSQHATANAIDIAGFTLRDGREITVLRHWNGQGPEAAFLRDVRDGACRWFRAVLSPDYNAAHRDHFHLDRGPWIACR
ncbi:extensin family protein [Roseomonas hellenica]|uniref:Extensin family protein n=1 Tax=Plastoroseomonas hellenica TaxID=2687306 RepID=A0ABS5F4H6_9PROT|nr:extensin family protein [Plastoroseomonas hellenica]MBR0667474.1 extensin family protein [Plastoroseomonas hellenica]